MVDLIDRILYNGSIITLDTQYPRASAVAIRGGRVVATGTDDEILALAAAGTIRENLNRRVVVPGMTDAHIHWRGTAEMLHQVNLYDLKSKSEALTRVAERAAATPKGEWVTGYGWLQDAWVEGRFPNAADLDTVVPDHPVFLRARSGHAAWVNSLAMRIAGIDRSTPDPDGGELDRDENGEPTGILLEWSAMDLVGNHVPPMTIDRLAGQMQAAQTLALSLGMTGIHDFDNQEALAALQLLRERDALKLRVVKNFNVQYLDAVLHLGLRRGFGDDWLRLGALKIFADGALGPHTAAMFEPYLDDPGNLGVVVTDKESIYEMVSRASAAGWPSTVHAIGDRAVHDVLDVFATVRAEEASSGIPRTERRHRIEHVQVMHPDDVGRLAELGIVASMQPVHATSDYPVADQVWGAARVPYSYNPRLQLDRGVVVAFGSDCPYDYIGVFRGIYAAVTRQRPDGSPGPDGWTPSARVTVDESLRAYTIGAAYAAGMDDRLGRLAPGYLADLVVIDRDPYAISPGELLEVQVVATMVDGLWRYGGLA
jgi:predicted amidohydrolase YtcJ